MVVKKYTWPFPVVTTSLKQYASPEEEERKQKKQHLVQSPNSHFMDVKCPGCYKITTVFSHAQTVVLYVGCSTILRQPTGGKERHNGINMSGEQTQ